MCGAGLIHGGEASSFGGHGGRHHKEENIWADQRFSVSRPSGRDEHSRRRKEHAQRERIMGYHANKCITSLGLL